MTQADTDRHFIDEARKIARQSPDRSRKVGCILVSQDGEVISQGFNALPKGCKHTDDRLSPPWKYDWTLHAETRSVALAAKTGQALDHCTAYVPWYPCPNCAGTLIDAGMKTLVAFPPDFDDPLWGIKFRITEAMLKEANIEVRLLEGAIEKECAA